MKRGAGLSPANLRTHPLRGRDSKVAAGRFARPLGPDPSISDFLASLPGFLSAADFREFLRRLRRAKARGRTIIAGCGAHVLKVGLSPVLIDLIDDGWITGFALNGAGVVHDFELAFCGRTSEDVAEQILTGEFGMARETGEIVNGAIVAGAADGLGLGAAVGRLIAGSRFPYKRLSVLAAAYERGIPATVHVAMGTDIIHMHPSADGRAIGETSLRDFYGFCRLLAGADGGGAYLNIGSAVVLPEVFLKAVSFVRNQGVALDDFTTAVFDFNRHYRPDRNVVRRPLGPRGKGYYFVGPHELLVPLVAAALKSKPA